MTAETITRANEGGFEDRFRVTRVDGKPIDPSRRYLVLAYDGSDAEAVQAIQFYAFLKESVNQKLSSDIRYAIEFPANWPAQHD